MLFFIDDLDRFFPDLDGGGCFIFLILFLILVAFLATVSRVLNRVAEDNRRMDPALVWLNLIPLLNLIWCVVTVERVGESIRNEMTARGRESKTESYGKTAGLTAIVLFSTVLVLPPPALIITWPFALIYGVVYWLQLRWYASRLRDDGSAYSPPLDEGW
jgi:hypothetical protein